MSFDKTAATPVEAARTAKNKIRVVLEPGAKAPTRGHAADAGLDLYAMEGCNIFPGTSRRFRTGVHVEIPAGYVGLMTSKSGMMLHNECTSRGTIDSGYTGEIHVVLFNHGRNVVKIKPGQKISQLVILPIITPDVEIVEKLEETDRGNGGFGSTGAF